MQIMSERGFNNAIKDDFIDGKRFDNSKLLFFLYNYILQFFNFYILIKFFITI